MSLALKLDRIVARAEELRALLNEGISGEAFTKASKELSEIEPVVARVDDLRAAEQARAEAQAMLDDADMRELAEAELFELKERIPALEHDIRISLLPRDEADDRSAILEIRPAAGGDEAGLFAAELFAMYQKYAATRGWRFEVMDFDDSGLGGIKSATAEITGKSVFARLKYESGVHRVQRVPDTEASGRIHTSAATVAVLPEAEAVDIQINPNDIRIDTMRASGAGGQHVNTTDSAVRITHLPTGIMVTSAQKSQHRNRELAMNVLMARLYDLERNRVDGARSADRRAQVGSGDRSERIRTYNFPQGRMTDHRINLTLYRLDAIMQGDLDEIIDALTADAQATLLAEMEG